MGNHRPTNPIRAIVIWSLLIFVLVLYVVFLLPRTGQTGSEKDFHHLWLAGRMVIDGQAVQLYDPQSQLAVFRDSVGHDPSTWGGRYEIIGCFNYPPPTAMYYAAFSWLPLERAAIVHASFTMLGALAIVWLFDRFSGARGSRALTLLLVLAYPAFFVNLAVGQNAVVTVLIFMGAAALIVHGREGLAGALLGILICKYVWLLAFLWVPLFHRRIKLLIGVLIGAAACCGLAAIAMGTQVYADYLQQLLQVVKLQDLPGYHLELKYNGLSLFRKWFGFGTIADALGALSCLVVAAATLWASHRHWQHRSTVLVRVISCALLAAMWINPHLNYYDLLLTPLCLIVLAWDWPAWSTTQRWLWGVLAVASYLAIPIDQSWSYWKALPLPSLVLFVTWLWSVMALRHSTANPILALEDAPQAAHT